MTQHTYASGGIRRGPRRADHFTIISNAALTDSRLSFRARGVLMWLLSKPADWRTRSESIAAQSPREGREAIRTAMRELEEFGYLVREKIQDPATGRWSTIQTVYEEPVTGGEPQVTPGPSEPVSGERTTGKLGAFTKDRAPRTETNNNRTRARSPWQCTANPSPSLSEKLSEIRTADDRKLTDLEAATVAAGLPASYSRIKATQRTAIVELIDQHGVAALVEAATRSHRDTNPTIHVNGWLRLWKVLPARSTNVSSGTTGVRTCTCGDCDGRGWLIDQDDTGPARRCTAWRTWAATV